MDNRGGSRSPLVLNDPKLPEALSGSKQGVDACVTISHMVFKDFDNEHVMEATEQLGRWDYSDLSIAWQQLNRRSVALRNAVEIELKSHYYYSYSKNKGKVLSRWKEDWSGCINAFPKTESDVFEAVDCFAMEKNTASVFHSMRVLENGLRVFAAELDVPYSVEVWQTIIESIESKIKSTAPTLPRGTEKSERLQFLAEAAKEFYYFKDGWRNHVAHNRAAYDEYQARSVLEHVRCFMNSLSRYLNEEATS